MYDEQVLSDEDTECKLKLASDSNAGSVLESGVLFNSSVVTLVLEFSTVLISIDGEDVGLSRLLLEFASSIFDCT